MIDPYEIDRQIRAEYRRSRLLLSEKLLAAAGVMLAVLVSVQGHTSDQALDHVLMTSTWIFLLSSMIAGIGVLLLDLMSQGDTLEHFYSECQRIVDLDQDTRPEPYIYDKKHSIVLILQLCIFVAASTCLTCYGIFGL